MPAYNQKFTIKQTHETTGVSLTSTLNVTSRGGFYLQNPTGKPPSASILWERHAGYREVTRKNTAKSRNFPKLPRLSSGPRTDGVLSYTAYDEDPSRCSRTNLAIRSAKAT